MEIFHPLRGLLVYFLLVIGTDILAFQMHSGGFAFQDCFVIDEVQIPSVLMIMISDERS